ncbi:MAG: nucleotidyltransferase domain-containing protein [Chloroflexota bacterium]|nr:MAG: nucleotidyltransferase domain-containing protein [Chloroflexota bacterium]
MYRLDPSSDPTYQAVEALRAGLGDRLVAVVLFGSRARGDAHEWSDWDLLVIAEGLPENPFERSRFLARMLPLRCRGEVSIIARTPQEFESAVQSLYLDIALDGWVLYDPHQYAAKRLAMLQRLIERLGLYRERTEDGDVWQWREEPSGPWELEWEQ